MAWEMHKTLMLFKMLKENKYITSKQVAKELEINLRSAQNYLVELENKDIVVRKVVRKNHYGEEILVELHEGNTQGAMNRFYWNEKNDQYPLAFDLLDEDEKNYMNVLLIWLKQSIAGDATIADKVKEKLKFPNQEAYFYISKDSNIELIKTIDKRLLIEKAIDHYAVSFRYSRYDSLKNKRVILHPYKILIYKNLFYLLGKNKDKIKTYSFNYIENLQIERKVPYEAIQKQELEKILMSTKSLWFEDRKKRKVEVAFRNRYKDILSENKIFPQQEIVDLQENRLVISFEVFNFEDLTTMLLPWLPDFQILEPEEFKNSMIEFLQSAIEFNG